MQQPRQVPKLGHQRPILSRDTLPPIQSPLAMQQPQSSPESAGDELQDLAMEIYARLAVAHIQHNQQTDRETLQQLSHSAMTAARVYFGSTNNGQI